MSEEKEQQEKRTSYRQQIVSFFRRPITRVLVAFIGAFLTMGIIYGLELFSGDKKSCETGEVEFLCRIRNSAFLGLIDNFSIVIVAILFILEAPDRKRQEYYQLWNFIDHAKGVETSYARYQALIELNKNKVSLKGLDAEGADLDGIDLEEANLEEASLERVKLNNTNLKSANLIRSKLQGAKLQNAELQKANFWLANLQKADLYNSKLQGANLGAANLQKAFLQKANLRDANLTGADLRGADLRDAILQNTELTGAKLQGVRNLTQVQVEGAKNWQQAKYDNNFLPELELIREETTDNDENSKNINVAKHREELALVELVSILAKVMRTAQNREKRIELLDRNTPSLLQGDASALPNVKALFEDWLATDEEIEETQIAKVRQDLADLENGISALQKVRDGKKDDQEAARWLSANLEILKTKAGEAALTKNPGLRSPGGLADSPEKIEQFYQDIYQYLSGLRDYLSRSENPQALYQGFIQPVLPCSVYVDALSFIVEQEIPLILAKDSQQLSEKGLKRLNFYLSECLIKGLQGSNP